MKVRLGSWAERAQRLLDEEAASGGEAGERVKVRLRWEDWATLGREAVKLAARELKRRHGLEAGAVLAGGYDAESIGAQAVADLLAGKGRVAAGWTEARLAKELERLVSRKIRLLTSLKEARTTRSEWDGVRPEAGMVPVSNLVRVPAACADGRETVLEREDTERRERLGKDFERYLDGEPELVELFRCLLAGETRPAVIAVKLGINEKEVAAARKRLERRMTNYGAKRGFSTR
jgi:hypothetical protein